MLFSGVPVISINTGSDGSFAADMVSSYYGDMNEEIAKACRFLAEQDDLKGGFNMIGFSQGGQFSRAVVQRCRFGALVCPTPTNPLHDERHCILRYFVLLQPCCEELSTSIPALLASGACKQLTKSMAMHCSHLYLCKAQADNDVLRLHTSDPFWYKKF